MYAPYWGLSESPFGNVPSSGRFYQSAQHEEALLRLAYAARERKGAAVLVGDVGSGKTTVGRVLTERLTANGMAVHMLVNPALTPTDLIRAIAMATGGSGASIDKSVLLEQLAEHWRHTALAGGHTVVMIDEAHVIEDRACLEELRMLLNLNDGTDFLATVILMGQPPLVDRIASLAPLQERIAIRSRLGPLGFADMVRYVLHRLSIAGATRSIFTREAMGPLYDFSQGLPLRINNACERSLLLGMMHGARRVESRLMRLAIADLES